MQPSVQRVVSQVARLVSWRRVRKIVAWTGGAVALFAVLGFFVAPPIARSQLERILSEKLQRQVAIERIRINPFAPSASVIGFSVKERDGSATVASFDALYVDLSYSSLVRLAPVVHAVQLTKPYVRLVRNQDKTYNFQDLIDRPPQQPAQPPASGPPPRFAVYNIRVTDGRIDFDDRPENAQHSVTELRLGIPFFSTLPSQVDIQVQPELSAKVNGAPLDIVGETKPLKDTHETTIRIDLDDLQLAKYLEYSPVPLRFRVPTGRLDTRLVVSLATVGERLSRLTVSGTASLQDLAIRQLDGSPLIAFGKLAVELDSLDIPGRNAAVKSVRLEAPSVDLVRSKDGRINLLNALSGMQGEGAAARSPDAAPSEPPFGFSIADIALADGRVRILDEVPAKPYRVELQNISLAMKELSNTPDTKAEAQLGFDTNAGGKLAYDGTIQLAPVRAGGKLDFTGFRLDTLQPYLEDVLNLEIAAGSLDVGTTFDVGPDGERFGGRLEGLTATIKGLRLLYPGDKEPLWQIPLVELKDAAVDLEKRVVSIGSWSYQDAKGHVRRDPDGGTNYARLLKPASAAPPASGAPQPEWRVEAKRLAISNGTVVIDDQSLPTPVQTKLTRFALDIEDFSNVKGARAKATLRTLVNGTGSVLIAGPLSQMPLSANLRVDVKGVELAPFQPYVAEHARVVLTGGAVSTKGTVALDLTPNKQTRLAYQGDFTVADFAALDQATSQDLLKWKSLFIGGIDFELEPLKVTVSEVALADFYSRLVLNADGKLNLQGLAKGSNIQGAPVPDRVPDASADAGAGAQGAAAKPQAEPPQPAAPADAPAQPPPAAARGLPANVRIGKVTLQGGNINYSDYFVQPNYSANLTGVGGGVTEMTPDKAGEVELRGRIDETAPVEILGQVNVLSTDLFVDLKASAKDIELPPLSPYSVKYAGYGIERGKLSVSVKYFVENRKLVADNKVILDQLTFGDKVESPTATKLPVLLAVALLKDRNGVIDVDLPISGSLDDPQFSVGGIIIHVIVNLIAKAVTAPFALLGSLFGGGEELAYVEFAPGSARLDADSEAKLKSLAKALTERPALKLDVGGRVDPEIDREGLKQADLERQVKAAKLKDTTPTADSAHSLEEVKIEPTEYPKYLAIAYKEAKFSKPRNMIGLVKDLPVPEMEQLVLANTQVTEEGLRRLADARAQSAKDWLVENGKVSADRVYLVPRKLTSEGIKDKGKPTRADFSLK